MNMTETGFRGPPQMSDDDKPVSPSPPRVGEKRVSTKELFAGGHTEILIVHEGLEYRLRITKQNRLILYR
jgi:hemin uptake protein HemP